MKRITSIAIALFISSAAMTQTMQPHDSIKVFVDYLKKGTFQTPKEYILKSFEDKDIVVLCERAFHPEFTQYEMIVEVIKDDRFKGNVYTEVGVYNVGTQINDFLNKENLSKSQIETEILNIFKNLDMFPLWPNYNYYYLIQSIYEVNQHRKKDDKILIYPLDLIFNWDSVKCNEQYKMFMEMMEPQNNLQPVIDRNAIMAKHFIRLYNNAKKNNPNKRKALIIMNTYHGYTRIPQNLLNPTEPSIYCTAEYIYKTFPSSTKGILINGVANSGSLVANGKWDAAFRVTGNKNIGFDFNGTPFGKTCFDMYCFGGNAYKTVNFEYIFDGFVFYSPIENFELVEGIPNIFNDTLFVEEFYRRTAIEKNTTLEIEKSSLEIQNYIKKKNVLKSEKIPELNEINLQIDKWIEK